MSQVSDEILMAYADGELTPEECQALERTLRHDPVLRARVEPFIQTRDRLSAAFAHTLLEPVPERLIATVRRARPPARASAAGFPFAAHVRSFLAAASAALAPGGLTPALAASMAVLVVAGATAGWLAGRTHGESPALIASSGPDLAATGVLAHALEATRSGTVSDVEATQASVVPVLSFKTADDTVCREYRVRSAGPERDFAGIACRKADGAWRIAQHVEMPKQATAAPDGYQTATGTNVSSIDTMIEAMMSGEAFGSEDEARLLKNGWQSAK